MTSDSVRPKHQGFAPSEEEIFSGEDEPQDTGTKIRRRKVEVRAKNERDRLFVCSTRKRRREVLHNCHQRHTHSLIADDSADITSERGRGFVPSPSTVTIPTSATPILIQARP